MSEAVAEAPAEVAAEPRKSGRLRLILIAVVVLAAAAGGVWYFMHKGAAKEAAPAAVLAPAIYVSFEPPFVVNFESGELVRFLQVTIQVMTRDPHIVEQLKLHDPVIRNDLLLLLGNQKYESIATREGKQQLQLTALEGVRNVIKVNGGEPEKVEALLFTSFVMQ